MKRLLFASIAFSLALSASQAGAQTLDEAEPAAADTFEAPAQLGQYTARTITPPGGTLSIIVGPASNIDLTGDIFEPGLSIVFFKDVEFCFFGACGIVEIEDPVLFVAGAAYGITDDLEVGAIAVPLSLAPDFEYGDPVVWGRYRLLPGELEIAAQALVRIPVLTSDAVFELGAPVRWHGPVRLDTGAYFQIDTDPDVGFRVPLGIAVNATPELFLGARSGLLFPAVAYLNDGYIPLEVFGGYTLSGASSTVDFTLQAGFPFFLALGDEYGDDALITEIFQVGAGVNVYLDL